MCLCEGNGIVLVDFCVRMKSCAVCKAMCAVVGPVVCKHTSMSLYACYLQCVVCACVQYIVHMYLCACMYVL